MGRPAAAQPAGNVSSPGIEELIAVIENRSGLSIALDDRGWAWREEDVTGTPERGELTFSDRKWMMYLIHWGPIQTAGISVDYVKARMLGMWGVDFEFTGRSGRTEVSGHDAVWVEAWGTDRAFLTRFIIWNCPGSGREFIADTNYNLRLKTPRQDFDDQWLSARTISCHEGAVPETIPAFGRRFDAPDRGFSFQYPGRWFMLDSPFHVPFPEYEGVRDRAMGSLLGLPADQNITVTIMWFPATADSAVALDMGFDRRVIESLQAEMRSRPGFGEVVTRGRESFSIDGNPVHRIWGTYAAPSHADGRSTDPAPEGVFQAAQWTIERKQKAVRVILRSHAFDYAGIRSIPDRDVLDRFLRDLVRSVE